MQQYIYPNIEAERKRMNITQAQLVNQLGIERKSYYNWLTKGNIPVAILIKMSDFFDCSIDYLLGKTRNPVRSN